MGQPPESMDQLRKRFAEAGQEHIFRFWDEISESERKNLSQQASSIDLGSISDAFSKIQPTEEGLEALIEPPSVLRMPSRGGDPKAWQEALERGEQVLAEGKAAPFVVAGGQGTRLGFSGPKGSFPIGPVSQRSLFELQAQKIHGLIRRYGKALPWYVMTSEATDGPTREFFRQEKNFGLSEEDVFFLVQAMNPAIDFEGKLILETPGKIFESPNGHGGSLTALLDSGALNDMEARGVETLFYYQVDNPLIRMCDPAFLGFHALANAEASSKVVCKRNAEEKMGVVARVNGHLGIVEYTELDEESSQATDEAGELLYWAGNIAVHLFERQFIERLARNANELLPLHPSAKKIPFVDENGKSVAPEASNGYKLERFVFDALPHAASGCVVETERAEEFSPVKNASGQDSADTARIDLVAEYRRWLGALAPGEGGIELDHSVFDGCSDVKTSGLTEIDDAGEAILIAAGDLR
ncbi:MAG: UDPGP type 1 family protein [Deltaproteobacteria bacterium]|nr:UDPGP type 1 family protein [Deltaproteobacteria bacterium]